MSLARDTRNLKKLKAALRAEFRLKQTMERIDWEYDVLDKHVLEFQGRAALPELPELGIVIEHEYMEPESTPKPRVPRQRK